MKRFLPHTSLPQQIQSTSTSTTSPQFSPNATRRNPISSQGHTSSYRTPTSSSRGRSPNSYTISASSLDSSRYSHRSNRSTDHNIDSGVYSANSSRDGTPVGGGGGGGGGGQDGLHTPTSDLAVLPPRSRSKVLLNSSPKRNNSTDQNGLLHRHNKGEGVYLDDHSRRSRINPNSLNLVAKTIEPHNGVSSEKPSRPSSDEYALEQSKERRQMKRSASEKPFSSSSSKSNENLDGEHLDLSKRESKSLPRGGNEIRPVSPLLLTGRDSATRSPEDIKLVS